jgi:hypothetical protein
MIESKRQLALNLFAEARKEILEYQRIRTQVIGFKITFVSAGIGLIAANSEKLSIKVLVVPAFAAVFFDLIVTSYSLAIKRTGFYCHHHIEPILRELYEWPEKYFLWEEFMRRPNLRQGLALRGNIGLTILSMILAIYALLVPFTEASWVTTVAIISLLLLLIYDIRKYQIPGNYFESMEEESRDQTKSRAA